MTRLRNILFFVFLLIFLVGSPLLVMHSFGYEFRLGQEHNALIKTGLIFLSTEPQGGDVYLENSRFSQKTPTTLSGLVSGEYKLRVKMPGRVTWSRRVHVRAGQALSFDKILLYPDHSETKLSALGPFKKLVSLPGESRFLLAGSGVGGEISVFEPRSGALKPLDESLGEAAGKKLERIHTRRQSPNVVFELLGKEGKKQFFWLGVGSDAPKDITALFIKEPEKIDWPSKSKRYLFNYHDRTLDRLDLATDSVLPEFAKDVSAFGFFEDQLYYLSKGRLFATEIGRPDPEEIEMGQNQVKALPPEPGFLDFFLGRKSLPELVIFSRHQVWLWNEKQGRLASLSAAHPQDLEGLAGLAEDKLERFVIWKKNKIGLLDTHSDWSVDWLIETKGAEIEQLFPAYDNSHVIFKAGGELRIAELTQNAETQLLVSVKSRDEIHYAESSGKLYFLDPETEGLLSMEIVPKPSALILLEE